MTKEQLVQEVKLISKAVQDSLSEELRYSKYRPKHPLAGFCYISSEACYHLLGGKKAGWKPYFMRVDGEPHWFIERALDKKTGTRAIRIDLTASQFGNKQPLRYDLAVGKGFLTKRPSRRAQIIIERVKTKIKEIKC